MAIDIELCDIEASDQGKGLEINLDFKEEENWRINPSGISRFFAFFLLFRSLMGIGILAYPHVLQEAGYIEVAIFFIP